MSIRCVADRRLRSRHDEAFIGFAVGDIGAAQAFYGETSGLEVSTGGGLLTLHLGDREVLVYPKPDHLPAAFMILNFRVNDVGRAVDELAKRGVRFQCYEGFDTTTEGSSGTMAVRRSRGSPTPPGTSPVLEDASPICRHPATFEHNLRRTESVRGGRDRAHHHSARGCPGDRSGRGQAASRRDRT